MDIVTIASNVNFSADPICSADVREKLDENVNLFLEYTKENPSIIIEIDGSTGFHVGKAFINSLNCSSVKNEEDKKFIFAGAILSLFKAIDLGTVQSILAAEFLKKLLQSYKFMSMPYFAVLTNQYMAENFNFPQKYYCPNLELKDVIEWRFDKTIYYLHEITETKGSFYGADIDKCKIGLNYLKGLTLEAKNNLMGFMMLGMIL